MFSKCDFHKFLIFHEKYTPWKRKLEQIIEGHFRNLRNNDLNSCQKIKHISHWI